MSWFWTVLFLCFTLSSGFLEAKHQKTFPSAVVVGTVHCDTCFQQDIPKASQFHFIPGASVAVECSGTSSRPSFQQEVKTNKHGEFKVRLPFSVSKHAQKIRGCSVKLISSNQPFCSVAASATSSSLHLKSRQQGTHIFSAGFFTFKPLKQPQLCDQKSSIKNSKKLPPISNPKDPSFPPPILDPPSDPPALGSHLPPMPRLPSLPPVPQLPRLPPLPRIPYLPPAPMKKLAAKASELLDKKVNQPMDFPLPPNPLNPPSLFPPNPLQPPPSIFPPNPFQPPPSIIPPIFPSPPPSIFPPIFPSPPPSTFPPSIPSPPGFHFPPIPGLFPSPPPPLPPVFPIPLPPFPFRPTPGFPGVPPAEVSSQPKASSP